MRLICPNCDTEYEVEDSMIPADGRDVQCSNCMNIWFQEGASAPSTVAPVAPPPPPSQPAYQGDNDEDGIFDTISPSALDAIASKRRSSQINPKDLEIIQEEVARERSARKAEATALETQIDLGLEEAQSARNRLSAQVDSQAPSTSEDADPDIDFGTQPPTEPAGDPEPVREGPKKRALLPDIEEINSTLADAPDPDELYDDLDIASEQAATQSNRSGFRLGFGLMLLLSAAIMGLYIYAPAFEQSVPALGGALELYVSGIDALRIWLDGSAQDLVDQITKLLAGENQA